MRPARIIAAVALATAVAATGSYLAVSTATHPSAAAQPPATGPPVSSHTHQHAAAWYWTRTCRPRPPTPRAAPRARPLRRLGAAGIGPGQRRRRRPPSTPPSGCATSRPGPAPSWASPRVRLLGAPGQPVTAPSRARGAELDPRWCCGRARAAQFRVPLPQRLRQHRGGIAPPGDAAPTAGLRDCAARPPKRGSAPAPASASRLSNPASRCPTPTIRLRSTGSSLIYGAVLRQYLTSGDAGYGDTRFPHIFALDHTVAGAGAPGHGVPGGGPISRAVQRAIAHALTDVGPLTFVASRDAVIEKPHGCAHVRGDGILVTLGPVDGSGDRVQVGINGFRACLGANSLTYLVERTGRGWAVSGITAYGPVA